MPKSILDP